MSQSFTSIKKASEFLFGQGWKISKSSMQRHVKKGMIKPGSDGAFSEEALRKYAGRHLVMRSTLTKVADEDLQREKIKAEVEKLQEQGKLARIRRMAEEGRYVLRESFDLELAARAAALEAGLRHMVQTRAGEFIKLVEGDDGKVGDLIREMNVSVDEALNEFASIKEFRVIFEANEGDEQASSEEERKDHENQN